MTTSPLQQSNNKLTPGTEIKKYHDKTRSVILQIKREITSKDNQYNQTIERNSPIKQGNELFLSSYTQIQKTRRHNPNLVFKEDIKKYREKGYDITDLNKVNIFKTNILLNNTSNAIGVIDPNSSEDRSVSESRKISNYIKKLDGLVLKKKLMNKGINKPIEIKNAYNTNKRKRLPQFNSDDILILTKNQIENNDLLQYNNTIESLIDLTETTMDNNTIKANKTIRTKHKTRTNINSPLFDKKTMSTAPKRMSYFRDILVYSVKDKETNQTKESSVLNTNNDWILKKKVKNKDTMHNFHKQRGNNITTISNNKQFSQQESISAFCPRFINNTPLKLRLLAPNTKNYYLNEIEKSESYYQLKRNMIAYYKHLGYTETKAYEYINKNSLSKTLISLIGKLKMNVSQYDIKAKSPVIYNSNNNMYRDRIDDVERKIKSLDKKYIKSIFKYCNT